MTPCTHVAKGGKHDLVGGHLKTSLGRFLALSVKSKWGLFHARKVVFLCSWLDCSAQCSLTWREWNEQDIGIQMPGEGLAPPACNRKQNAGIELTLGLGALRSGLQHPAGSCCPAEARSKKIGFCYR